MDKTRIKVFGRQLRQRYVASDDLPFPMRKALQALANKERPKDDADNDDLPQTRGSNGQYPISINVHISRKHE